MKLSKIILENKKIVHKAELDLSEKDVEQLTEAITSKLNDYLDIENETILNETVKAAINDLLVQ